MKWLQRFPHSAAQDLVDKRFVAQAPPPQPRTASRSRETPTRRPDSLAPQPQFSGAPEESAVQQDELSCVLVTEDRELTEQVAEIALAAAVRIRPCTLAERLDLAQSNGPVLWGADLMAQLSAAPDTRCDVLLGGTADTDQLWLMASTRPLSRVAILPQARGWLGEYLGQWALRSGQGYTLSFSGLAGGIGTSTLASLMAHVGTLSGLRTVLIDLDPFSRSMWPILDWQPSTGIGWEQLQSSRGALAAHQFGQALASVQQTSVLTWQQEPGLFSVDESLIARVLAASRQVFDLVVVDAGRHPHPLTPVLAQFTDQLVLTGQPEQHERLVGLGQPFIGCGSTQRISPHSSDSPQLLGCFPLDTRIARSIERRELWEALRSRRLRRRLADYDLLPPVKAG